MIPRPSPRSLTWAARLVLAAGCAAAFALLAVRDAPRRIATDALDLVPRTGASPELALLRGMAADRQARVVLIALGEDAISAGPRRNPGRLAAARDAVIASLRRSGAFEDAEAGGGGSFRDAVGGAVFDRRLDLLGPGWLGRAWRRHAGAAPAEPWSAWLAEATAARLESFLARPEAPAFEDILDRDPLLLLPDLAERTPVLEEAPPASSGGLVWALARGDPLSTRAQSAVARAVKDAALAAREAAPGVVVRWTGVARLAAWSRMRIEAEVVRLNLLSIAAVLAVAVACLRRPLGALLLAPVVLFSMLGAWTAATVVFPKVHVFVFVVGSLLCGVAIDYGFYLLVQPAARPGESYPERVGRLLKPLLASSLTIVLGFALLLASDLPVIRQVGVFVGAGLLTALAAAILWFAQTGVSRLETRSFVQARPRPGSRSLARAAAVALPAAALVAAAGILRLRWRDDVRDLEVSSPALDANDRDLRARFGDTSGRTVYFTQGATPRLAREALDRFAAWHERVFPRARLMQPGQLLPEPADWDSLPERLSGLGSFEADLRSALARHGFDPGAFKPFFADWSRWRSRRRAPSYDALAREFADSLKGPASLAISCRPDGCRLATLVDGAETAVPPPSTDTISARQLESLNRLFGRYRLSALRLSVAGLGLVGLSVFVLYGLRRGPAIFAIPCGSCLFAFGLLGLLGRPINLFHLLGAFLGVCLAHNYSIFRWESAARGEAPPPSIRLSALCAAASFGVLGLSSIPAVSALGSTVALTVVAALAAVELTPPGGGGGLATEARVG